MLTTLLHCASRQLWAKSRRSGRFWILLLPGKGAQVRGASPVKLPRRQFLHLATGAAALSVLPRVASALDYPTRPVRLIVGFFAGGLSDILARLIAQSLSERLGQQVVRRRSTGCWVQSCYRDRSAGATRRLHPPSRPLHCDRQRHALRQSEFQLRPRYRPGRDHLAHRGHHGRQFILADSDGP